MSGGVLLVHAHPDDEVMSTGGTIARSLAEGRRVDLVVCTGGEEGEIHDPELDPTEAQPRLAEIRSAELACSVAALGAGATGGGALHVHRLGHRDSGMMGGPANEHPDAFWQADLETAAEPLVRIIRETRPAVVVHYDAFGGYGHPDHIQAHRIAVAACAAAADPDRYPEAGPIHEVAKRYQTGFSRDRWTAVMRAMVERGIALPWGLDDEADSSAADGDTEQVAEEGEEEAGFGTPEAAITTRVDVTPWLAAKRAAMVCHRTQRQDFGWAIDLPEDLLALVFGVEVFVLQDGPGADASAGLAEDSLFAGL